MLNSLLHSQPLLSGVLRCNHNVHIVLGTDAVIEYAQQAVSVGWQIHSNNICLLVSNVIEEAGILVSETVVVLLPYVGRKDVVKGCDLMSPRQLGSYLQPLSVL